MTRADLLEVVYRFYPRGLLDDHAYLATEEYRRLADASRHAFEDYPRWKAMIERLADRLGSLRDYSMCILAGGAWPAYSAAIYLRESGQPIGVHVSALGPLYGIHRTGSHGERTAARLIAREIETTYPGYEPIPTELGNVHLPDVMFPGFAPGETIHVCLLSLDWKHTVPPAEPGQFR